MNPVISEILDEMLQDVDDIIRQIDESQCTGRCEEMSEEDLDRIYNIERELQSEISEEIEEENEIILNLDEFFDNNESESGLDPEEEEILEPERIEPEEIQDEDEDEDDFNVLDEEDLELFNEFVRVVGENNLKNINLKELDNLSDNDLNMSSPVIVEQEESIEEDVEDRIDSINYKCLPVLGKNIMDQLFCFTESYVCIITSERTSVRRVCMFCYYVQQFFIDVGSHYHVNSHMKQKMKDAEFEIPCALCGRNLYQITKPEICLFCNGEMRSLNDSE